MLTNRDGCVARDLVLLQGARRENILYGSLSDEQRSSGVKDRATLRAELWRAAGGVAPQSQSAAAMLFRRTLPATRQNSAHQSLFMSMGSNAVLEYLESQEEHHRTRSFQEEYRGFLRKYGVEFDERYVWD